MNDTCELSLWEDRELDFSLLTHQSLVKGPTAGEKVETGISALLCRQSSSSSLRAVVQNQSYMQTVQSQLKQKLGKGHPETVRGTRGDLGGT